MIIFVNERMQYDRAESQGKLHKDDVTLELVQTMILSLSRLGEGHIGGVADPFISLQPISAYNSSHGHLCA